METINWKKKMEEQLRRSGFTLEVENMANLGLTEIHASSSPLIFYPLRIRLYERMGWLMCTVDATTVKRDEEHPLFERMIAAVFERIVRHLYHAYGFHLLTYIGNTGNYIVPKESDTGEIVHLIAQIWTDRSFLHLETYEEFPALYVTPPWAHQAYAFESTEDEWVIYAGRSGRPASDYRADGTELRSHHLAEGDLFFPIGRIPKQRGLMALTEWLRLERQEVEDFLIAFMRTMRKFDPSFGFSWGATVTFFHGVPVEPYVQVLRLESGRRRYRVMNNSTKHRIAATVSDNPLNCLKEVEKTLRMVQLPEHRVSSLGQLVMGIWQQFELDEETYIQHVAYKGISPFQIEEKIGHALSNQQRIRWIDKTDPHQSIIEYAHLKITFPKRPPGVVTVEPVETSYERGAL